MRLLHAAVVVGLTALLLTGMAATSDAAAPKEIRQPTPEELRKIDDAAPDAPLAPPARPRRVLVWGRMDAHDPNPFAAHAVTVLGRKTGAFEAVVSEDPAAFDPANLKTFDAIVMNNVHRPTPLLPENLKSLPKEEQDAATKRAEAYQEAILDFVRGGKGLAGIHAATAAFQKWPAYGEMIGGFYGGHAAGAMPIRVVEPAHPLCAMFGAAGFTINDEIYFHREPHDPAKLRILLALDLAKMPDPAKRPDKVYAISWVKPYGQGRVFYSTLGHAASTYWSPAVLRHFLAGIQFALGDLKADSAPAAQAP
jgi:hypothetical protein